MTCKHCTAAEPNPAAKGRYDQSCTSCKARDLALSPMAHKAMGGHPAELQEAMHRVFAADYRAGRLAVWQWIERIKRIKHNAEH
jgi:hypothetical protein